MKKVAAIIIFFIISSLCLPITVFFIMDAKESPEKKSSLKEEQAMIDVFFADENKVKNVPLEEYLVGVVSAEMPASFELEAIKAQAVAARSYAVYKQNSPQNERHPDAAVCTDFSHCKAYKTQERARADWGKNSDAYEKKIRDAVNLTKGEIITYEGSAVLAVFHSQSGGGRTENSKDVWGGTVPYLVSVESHGEENAPNFYSSADVSFEQFKRIITTENSLAKVNSPSDIGRVELSDGGAVKSITIGGQSFTGSKIRSLFSLRSACFTITANNENVHFEVHGYGHGVGMSQYGANELAKKGYTYEKILLHYYTGTKLDYMNI